MNTNELILIYVGTLLIAYEFIRESKDIQALIGLIFGWPVRNFLNRMAIGRKSEKENIKRPNIILVFLYLILLPAMFLLMIIFYLLDLILGILDTIHNLVNIFYLKAQKEYKPTYKFWIRVNLRMLEQNKKVTEQQVIDKLQERKIRILPIIGVVLITISFIIQLT
jgi:hypothetical protein